MSSADWRLLTNPPFNLIRASVLKLLPTAIHVLWHMVNMCTIVLELLVFVLKMHIDMLDMNFIMPKKLACLLSIYAAEHFALPFGNLSKCQNFD